MSGNAELAIQLDGSNTVSASTGVHVCANSGAASLSITGSGSLTASGNPGILYEVSGTSAVPDTVTLTISDSALVDAREGGIGAGYIGNLSGVSPTDDSVGIVFGLDLSDSKAGTMYGNVTLQGNLEISEGESLTLDDGASLDANGNNVIVDGDALDEGIKNSLGDSVKCAPTITTTSLSNGTVGTYYEQALAADGTTPITWSVDSDSLPAGLSLDVSTGVISGTPKAEGVSTFTVEVANDYGSDSREFTLSIDKSEVISVTGVKLDKPSLTLQETGSDTLTVTVEPDNATNKNANWESSDTSIATVDASGKVTAISAGSATITATAADGSEVSASCSVTVTHGNMVHTPKKDATCTADGNEEHWTCETCGKYFSNANGNTEIAEDSWIISAINHNWNDAVYTWNDDGSTCTAARTCKNDKSHTETSKATVTDTQTKAPTCTEKGETTYTATFEADWATTQKKVLADIPATGHHYVEGKCSVCGAIEATATVPDADNSQEGMDNTAASNKALPETSDSTLPLAVVALILGIGAITGIVIALRNMRR
ncbi:MAG: Ig-like domain-containing protein [Eggerthellaceae bacterium]|nr:Ig-like domain-containing protein [Eggerthellaceae bacterium]